MELYLFSGFLGSGKTTVVAALAKHLTQVREKKVMLIINDVGEIGIDAQLMRKLDKNVYELFGGCVCGQLGNLVNLLNGIGNIYDVDTVLMEASGIAQPIRFLDTIEKFVPQEMSVKSIVIIDASRWLDLIQVIDQLLISQIESADFIIINKKDATDEVTLDRVKADIRKIKDSAPILMISAHDSVETVNILEVIQNG